MATKTTVGWIPVLAIFVVALAVGCGGGREPGMTDGGGGSTSPGGQGGGSTGGAGSGGAGGAGGDAAPAQDAVDLATDGAEDMALPDGPAGADTSAPTDAGGEDLHPECPKLANLLLSAPRIAAGRVASGQSATLELTLTNDGESDYARYPGALLASVNPGISFSSEVAI